MRLIASLIIVLAVLAGCGKKGPLYLPDQNTPIATNPEKK